MALTTRSLIRVFGINMVEEYQLFKVACIRHPVHLTTLQSRSVPSQRSVAVLADEALTDEAGAVSDAPASASINKTVYGWSSYSLWMPLSPIRLPQKP